MTIPADNPDLYDKLIVGTTRSPGVVTLSDHDRNFAWNITSPKGSSGATSKLEGEELAKVTASFYLADDADFADWAAFERMLSASLAGPVPRALPIYHPDLAQRKIIRVSVVSIGALRHDGQGGATVVVKFVEYRPPKKKPPRKAKAEGQSPSIDERPDPLAGAKAELADLLARARTP